MKYQDFNLNFYSNIGMNNCPVSALHYFWAGNPPIEIMRMLIVDTLASYFSRAVPYEKDKK